MLYAMGQTIYSPEMSLSQKTKDIFLHGFPHLYKVIVIVIDGITELKKNQLKAT